MRFQIQKYMLVIILFLFINCHAQEKVVFEKFGHEIEKLPAPEKASFYTFKNGFRVILYNNYIYSAPLHIYLHVDTGSLNERENRSGVAHFIEHMAFNGTKNYPKQNISEFFRKNGIRSGPDANAYTNYEETIYKVITPISNSEEVLKILSDIATNITFLPEEIEKERSVILSEKKLHNKRDNDLIDLFSSYSLPKFVVERNAIGTNESLLSINREDLIEYYEQWYRPEKMTLIIVGRMNTPFRPNHISKKWIKIISENFSKIKAKKTAKEPFQLKDPNHKGNKFNFLFNKDAINATIDISTLSFENAIRISHRETYKNELADMIAIEIFNNRFNNKIEKAEFKILSGKYYSAIYFKKFKTSGLIVECKNENWKDALNCISLEINETLKNGFTDKEFNIIKNELKEKNKENNGAYYADSEISRMIINSISKKMPFLGGKQDQELIITLINEITKEDVFAYFKKNWAPDHRLINITGNIVLKEPLIEIQKEFESSLKLESKKTESETEKNISNPFVRIPDNKNKIKIKDLKNGVWRSTLQNNIRVNLCNWLGLSKDIILIKFVFGWGALSAPKDKPGIVHLADDAFSGGGLTTISASDLKSFLGEKNADVSLNVKPNSFELFVSTDKVNLEVALQHSRAKLLTPGFREEAKKDMKNKIENIYSALQTNVDKEFSNLFLRAITNNNFNVAIPERKILDDITVDDVRKWLTTEFAKGSLEINVIGNIDTKYTLGLVNQYFSDLPYRMESKGFLASNLINDEIFDKTETIHSLNNKALVAQYIKFSDKEYEENKNYIRYLCLLLDVKIKKNLREKLGVSYSPSVTLEFNKQYSNSNYFLFLVDTDPKNIGIVKNNINEIIKNTLNNETIESEHQSTMKILREDDLVSYHTFDFTLNTIMNSRQNPDDKRFFHKAYWDFDKTKYKKCAQKYLNINKKCSLVLKSELPPQNDNGAIKEEIKTE